MKKKTASWAVGSLVVVLLLLMPATSPVDAVQLCIACGTVVVPLPGGGSMPPCDICLYDFGSGTGCREIFCTCGTYFPGYCIED